MTYIEILRLIDDIDDKDAELVEQKKKSLTIEDMKKVNEIGDEWKRIRQQEGWYNMIDNFCKERDREEKLNNLLK